MLAGQRVFDELRRQFEATHRHVLREHIGLPPIEQPDGTIQCPPDIDARLHTGQRLVAVVPQGDARRPG